jgi:hypothetical protein
MAPGGPERSLERMVISHSLKLKDGRIDKSGRQKTDRPGLSSAYPKHWSVVCVHPHSLGCLSMFKFIPELAVRELPEYFGRLLLPRYY